MRDSWDTYFQKIASLVAERSTCLRRKVGAVAVRDNHILCTGYNGSPTGFVHCEKLGCLREEMHIPSGERHELCRAVHAEGNVIAQAARFGISLDGATLYCTTQPCVSCLKLLVNAGIIRIVWHESYPDELSEQMLKESGVATEVV